MSYLARIPAVITIWLILSLVWLYSTIGNKAKPGYKGGPSNGG